MRKFEMSAEFTFEAAVPDAFVQHMREEARSDTASEFLRVADTQHPQDDDEFILCVLRNGLKRHIRASVMDLLRGSGIGGNFSPVQLRKRVKEHAVRAVLPSEVTEVIPK